MVSRGLGAWSREPFGEDGEGTYMQGGIELKGGLGECFMSSRRASCWNSQL